MERGSRAWRGTATLWGVVLLLLGCAPSGFPAPRLVVLYAACSVNKDFLSPYAPEVPSTLALERFAREGVVFSRHAAEAGQSGIAFAALFSGVHADRHGAYRHPVKLPDALYQVSEVYRDAGYETHFWSGQRMGSAELGYGQGVPEDNVHVRRAEQGLQVYSANDPEFDAMLAGLASDPARKAFAQINLTLSHSPYQLYANGPAVRRYLDRHPEQRPDGLDDAKLRRFTDLYARQRLALQWSYRDTVEELGLTPEEESELQATIELLYTVAIWKLDRFFGRLVERIEKAGLLDESLIVFTADHGEVMYRDNALYQWTHGLQLAPEVLDVPLIARGPSLGLEPGRFESLTRSIDVLPTMAGLSGIELPAGVGIEGVDLSSALRGESPPPRLLAYSHTTTLSPTLLALFQQWPSVTRLYPREDPRLVWARIRDRDVVYKLVNRGEERFAMQVFDLAEDPGERRNLHDSDDPTHRAMEQRLVAYRARLVAEYGKSLLALPGAVPTGDELERLRALGYVDP